MIFNEIESALYRFLSENREKKYTLVQVVDAVSDVDSIDMRIGVRDGLKSLKRTLDYAYGDTVREQLNADDVPVFSLGMPVQFSQLEMQYQNFLTHGDPKLIERTSHHTHKKAKLYREAKAQNLYDVLDQYSGYILPYEIVGALAFGSTESKQLIDTSVRVLRKGGHFEHRNFYTQKDFGLGFGINFATLDPLSYKLLQLFWMYPNTSFSREELLLRVWNEANWDTKKHGSKLYTAVKRLNTHLQPTSLTIESIHEGYWNFRYSLTKRV